MPHAETSAGNTVLAAQSTFRKVMDATARPGLIETINPIAGAPAALAPAAAAIALTLFDHDTPIWLDAPLARSGDVASWLRFQTGCPIVTERERCAFALIGDVAALPSFESFALGTPDYPDRSTTLILQLPTLGSGDDFNLSGPGVRGTTRLSTGGLPQDVVERLAANRALFPRGVDLLLVAGTSVAALPRTTIVARV
jgi:alpha-D-ribose 1-methylphosphonate 5-triphosphate synthase subunit PhnH